MEFLKDADRPNPGQLRSSQQILYGTGDPIEALGILCAKVITVHGKDGDWPESIPAWLRDVTGLPRHVEKYVSAQHLPYLRDELRTGIAETIKLLFQILLKSAAENLDTGNSPCLEWPFSARANPRPSTLRMRKAVNMPGLQTGCDYGARVSSRRNARRSLKYGAHTPFKLPALSVGIL
jgi:hypothetical protein